mmetsp:Transcript_21040/g.41692  ORF Transcript_21040/g.41692 Transcript_21040/m.41692 type:complete len:427 (-) Transcript_21040:105-1385(-)
MCRGARGGGGGGGGGRRRFGTHGIFLAGLVVVLASILLDVILHASTTTTAFLHILLVGSTDLLGLSFFRNFVVRIFQPFVSRPNGTRLEAFHLVVVFRFRRPFCVPFTTLHCRRKRSAHRNRCLGGGVVEGEAVLRVFLHVFGFLFGGLLAAGLGCLRVLEPRRQRVLAQVQVLHQLLDVAVLFQHLERGFGADARDLVAVVAPAQDAQVNKLRARQPQALQQLVVAQLLDGLRRAPTTPRGKGELLEQVRGRKRQRVHVLRARRKHASRFRQHRALRLRLPRRLHHGHPHQPQQGLRVFVVLPGHFHQSARELVDCVHVVALLRGLELFRRFGPRFRAFRELAALQGRGLAVEHVARLEPVRHHADGSVEYALDVTRGFPGIVREHGRLSCCLLSRPDSNNELVHRHGRIDGHFSTGECFDVLFF